MSSPNYPSKFDNDPSSSGEVFRDMSLINQPTGCIEFVNTKDEETLTVEHKSGSYDRFDKKGKESLVVRGKREHIVQNARYHVQGNQINLYDQDIETIILGDVTTKIGDISKWQVYAEQYKSEIRKVHDEVVRLFDVDRVAAENSLDQSPNQQKSGSHAKCPSHSISSKTITVETPSNVSNTTSALVVPTCRQIQQITATKDGYKNLPGGGPKCYTCGGSNQSPSSQDGNFSAAAAKSALTSKRIALTAKLLEFERHMGQNKHPNGGSQFLTIGKDYIINVGLVMNDLESYRRDPIGKSSIYGVKLAPDGKIIYPQYKASPLVETVDVEKLLGGSYELHANNNFNVTAGSGGIDLMTSGQMRLGGTIFNMAMQNISMHSNSEIALVSKRIDLNADIISFRPNLVARDGGNDQQLVIDGNLNVTLNSIIKGGLHVEGEMSLHHITAPMEWRTTGADFEKAIQTEPRGDTPAQDCPKVMTGKPVTKSPPNLTGDTRGPTYGDLLPGALIGYAIGKDSNDDTHCLEVWSVKSDNLICMHPHYHSFQTLPMTLHSGKDSHEKVRIAGSENNNAIPAVANGINDKLNPPSASDKPEPREKGEKAQKPNGEGAGCSQYENLESRLKDFQAQMEQQCNQLKSQLAAMSNLNFNLNIDQSDSQTIITGSSPVTCS